VLDVANRGRLTYLHGIVLLLAATPPPACYKADVLTLENSDRLIGEIIELKHGRLEIKTDAIGTVYIECPKVSGLTPANACSSTIPSGFSSKTLDYGQFSVRYNPIPIGE
jgi:hypothetical protein